MIPYARQQISEMDVQAVVDVLRSDWLTTGPTIERFEAALAARLDRQAVAVVSSGTAALHCAAKAAGIGPGDEVIVPSMTFVATASAIVQCGARPVFCDVYPGTLLISVDCAEQLITRHTKAIIGVDYAGQPSPVGRLRTLAKRHGLWLIVDGCHSLGVNYKEKPDLTAHSFHPVKHITTGEGGAVATDEPLLIDRVRSIRNHGINIDATSRSQKHIWHYDVAQLGWNYRITDIQCALGLSQLTRLDEWIARRRAIARLYDVEFKGSAVHPIARAPGSVCHLYVVDVPDRDRVFKKLRKCGIGVNVHYRPVHLHSFYRSRFGTSVGQLPVAEEMARRILTLPLFPALSDDEVKRIAKQAREIVRA